MCLLALVSKVPPPSRTQQRSSTGAPTQEGLAWLGRDLRQGLLTPREHLFLLPSLDQRQSRPSALEGQHRVGGLGDSGRGQAGVAGTASPPGPTERAAEGAEGRCGRVVPTPSARCGGSSPETTAPRAGRTCCRPGAATSPGFAVFLCREGAFKNWSSALLDPKHFHQTRDSEVREVRLPSVSCPQHLFLSLEEQVSRASFWTSHTCVT